MITKEVILLYGLNSYYTNTVIRCALYTCVTVIAHACTTKGNSLLDCITFLLVIIRCACTCMTACTAKGNSLLDCIAFLLIIIRCACTCMTACTCAAKGNSLTYIPSYLLHHCQVRKSHKYGSRAQE